MKLVGTEKPIGERTDTSLASLSLSVSEQELALIVSTRQKRRECFLEAPTKAFHDVPTGYCEKVSVGKGDVRIRTPITEQIEVAGTQGCSTSLVVSDDVVWSLMERL